MDDFLCAGPFGPLDCIVEKYRGPGAAPAVLVICHGFRGSREGGGRALVVAQAAAAFCDVVRWNFSSTRILSEWRQEILAVLKAVRRRAPAAKLFLMGRSLGGACALITAAQTAAVDGLILWAAPADLRGTFRDVMGEADFQRLAAGQAVHYDDERGVCDVDPAFLTDFANFDFPALWQAWGRRPVLILHCLADEMVAARQAETNARLAAGAGAEWELHLFAGGDHSFTTKTPIAAALIAAWLEARLAEA